MRFRQCLRARTAGASLKSRERKRVQRLKSREKAGVLHGADCRGAWRSARAFLLTIKAHGPCTPAAEDIAMLLAHEVRARNGIGAAPYAPPPR